MAGAPIRVRVQFAAVEGQRSGGRGEQIRVQPREQIRESAFIGRGDHQNAGSLFWRKQPIVEVVAVQGHKRAPQLTGQPEVLNVSSPPQVGVLHDGENIPMQTLAHVADYAGRHVGVGVDAGPRG
jgi:hypothetical protein